MSTGERLAEAGAEPSAQPVVDTPRAAEPIAADGGLTLALSIVLPALLIIFFFFSRRGGSRGSKVVLLGPSNSGKTSIYLQLRHGRTSPTVTSMAPTTASVSLKSDAGEKAVQLMDAPGSGRLRGHLMGELAGTAAFVCVLDGTCVTAHAKEAAQLLYDVLTHEAIERSPPPLLVAVNKSDLPAAAAPAAARKLLEAEVSRVRLARTTMQDTSERTRQHRGIAAGNPDVPFSFDQLDSPVEFVACSASKPSLASVVAFMVKNTR